jgi:hypothetical protein
VKLDRISHAYLATVQRIINQLFTTTTTTFVRQLDDADAMSQRQVKNYRFS